MLSSAHIQKTFCELWVKQSFSWVEKFLWGVAKERVFNFKNSFEIGLFPLIKTTLFRKSGHVTFLSMCYPNLLQKKKDDEPSLKYLRTRGHTTDSYGSLPVVWNKAIHMIFIKRWKSCSLLQDIAERFDFPKGLSSKIQNSIMFFELQICRTVFTKNTRPWYSLKISRRQNVSNAWIPEFRSFQKILNKSGNNEHLIRKL